MDDENPTTYAELPADLNNDKLPFYKGEPPPRSAAPPPPPGSSYAPPPGYSYAGQLPPGYAAPPGYAYAGQPPPGYQVVFVEDSGGFYPPGSSVVVVDSADNEDAQCALCGLCFSWLVLVGWITFCMNISAPPGSRRRRYAQQACGVATTVFILNIIFYYTVY